jgi:hypothetical protein
MDETRVIRRKSWLGCLSSFSLVAVALANHRLIWQVFYRSLVNCISCAFPVRQSCDFQHKRAKSPKKDGRDICPVNDDTDEAPIGYSVNKYALVNMGVIHQWEIFFYKVRGLVYIWRPRGNDVKWLINTLGRKEGLTLLIVLWRRVSYSKRGSCRPVLVPTAKGLRPSPWECW